MSRRFLLLVVVAVVVGILMHPQVDAKRLPAIHWNSSNKLVERFAAIGDTLEIMCPEFDSDVPEHLTEQSIIYRVTEEEYENCEKRSGAKELGRCTSPYTQDRIKVAFRLFSPNPSGLDYRPGTVYYFISTSTGTKEGLMNERGGLCASHSLKMIIQITDKHGNIATHSHRHHRVHHNHQKAAIDGEGDALTPPSSSQAEEAPEASTSPPTTGSTERMLWDSFFEKVQQQKQKQQQREREGSETPEEAEEGRGESPSRPMRVMVDKKDEYLAGFIDKPLDVTALDYIVHEIGDVESLSTGSSSLQNFALFAFVLPMVLLIRT